jgi:hypothetical protein
VEKSSANFSTQTPGAVSFGSRTQQNTDVELGSYETKRPPL